MPDKHPNFESLMRERVEDKDTFITAEHESRSRAFTVVAPHAGKIERVTTTLAREIAGDDYCLYLFEGDLKRDDFAELAGK